MISFITLTKHISDVLILDQIEYTIYSDLDLKFIIKPTQYTGTYFPSLVFPDLLVDIRFSLQS